MAILNAVVFDPFAADAESNSFFSQTPTWDTNGLLVDSPGGEGGRSLALRNDRAVHLAAPAVDPRRLVVHTRWCCPGRSVAFSYLLFGFGVSAAAQRLSVQFDTHTQKIRLVCGATLLGEADITRDTWYTIVLDAYCHDTEGYAHLYLDGHLVVSVEDADTSNNTNDITNVIVKGNVAGTQANDFGYFRWFIIDGADADVGRSCIYDPVGADEGTPYWAPDTGADLYTQLEEAPHDGDDSYIRSTDEGDIAQFAAAMDFTGLLVEAVRPLVIAKREAAEGTSAITLRLRHGASVVTAADRAVTTTYLPLAMPWILDVPGGTGWTNKQYEDAVFEIEHVTV